MEEKINIERLGIPNLGNFVQFAGCTTCEKKCDGPGEVLSTAGKVLHPGIICPHYENFRSVNITDKYVTFWGGPFSNFYPCKIVHHGHEFKSSEQLFMYCKALFFGDDETVKEILKAKTPKEAKSLGRQVKGFNDEAWTEVREMMMYTAVYQKFKQNEGLKKYLINPVTEARQFVEASKFDRIWGIGLGFGEDDDLICDEKNWLGQNLLGKVLDKVRVTLINEKMIK